jgi:flagellar FliL protein
MADEKEKSPENSGEAPKKSKVMLLAIIGLALLLIAGGGFFVYSKFLAQKPQSGDQGEGLPGPDKETKVIGVIFVLEPFTVNLADPKGKRYLKLKVELELNDEKALEIATLATPKLRDMVIMMLTSLSFEEVMTPEGKIRIRDELLERFNQILRPTKVKNIYFTEFVVQ